MTHRVAPIPRLVAILAALVLLPGCMPARQTAATVHPVPAPLPILIPPMPVAEAPTPRPIVACLSPAEARRLRGARPKPLRSQKMPVTPAERVARTGAQLGLYEATGAWADQVDDALKKCD